MTNANASVMVEPMAKEVTTEEAANLLGVTPARVRQFVMEGRLECRRLGRHMLLFELSVIQKFKKNPPGRPKSNKDKD